MCVLMGLVSIWICILIVGALNEEPVAPVEEPYVLNENILWDNVLAWRLNQGLSVYVKDPKLCEYARSRVLEVSRDWSHDGFLGDEDWMHKFTGYSNMGENLAKGYNTEDEVLKGWLFSPTHKENLLESYTHSCIVCKDGFCAQEFGHY